MKRKRKQIRGRGSEFTYGGGEEVKRSSSSSPQWTRRLLCQRPPALPKSKKQIQNREKKRDRVRER